MKSLEQLISLLTRLPSIGEKSAQRLAHFIIKADASLANELAEAIVAAKQNIHTCSNCFQLTEQNPCEMCCDERRASGMVCVAETAQDVLILQKIVPQDWRIHVLQGTLSPVQGRGPAQLRVAELEERVVREGIHEIIMATNPTVEGDVTALYLNKLFSKKGIKVSKIARGLPMGSHLEYIDHATIESALQHRVSLN